MVCQGITEVFPGTIGLAEYLVFPTTCFYYFYASIFFGIFIVIAWTIYMKEKESFQKPDMISTLGVTCLAIFFLALIGTLIKTSPANGSVPMIQSDIFRYILAFTVVFVSVWFFKRD